MIVSHKYKFIYIKTAKTAGTSMVIYLSHICGEGDLITSLKKQEIEESKHLGYERPHGFKSRMELYKLFFWKLSNYFVSNPKLKKTSSQKVQKNLTAYSAKKYLAPNIWNNYFKFCFERNPFDKAVSLYYWHTRNFEKKPNINEFILSLSQSRLSNWHVYTIDDQIAVDFVGMYETLDDDVIMISKKLGFPDLIMPRAKGSSRKKNQHYNQLLNKESRKHIEKMCANEIQKFDFKWEE